jgi:hypothetical protein
MNSMSVQPAVNTGNDSDARMRALLCAFRQVGLPLMQVMNEPGEAGAADIQKFGTLVDGAVMLSNALAEGLGASEDALEAWVRWALIGASAQIVATSYQASGAMMTEEDAKKLATLATDLQARLKAQIPADAESVPNTLAVFRARMMEALVPVIGAVARFSFGQAEHGLVAEVAERLVRSADQVTRSIAPANSTPQEWRILCWGVMRAAGQIYADSHYAESDRLLYMEPDARAAYYAQHGNIPPMTQVWQAFNQRMAMLATLATYLDVPAAAHMEGDTSL